MPNSQPVLRSHMPQRQSHRHWKDPKGEREESPGSSPPPPALGLSQLTRAPSTHVDVSTPWFPGEPGWPIHLRGLPALALCAPVGRVGTPHTPALGPRHAPLWTSAPTVLPHTWSPRCPFPRPPGPRPATPAHTRNGSLKQPQCFTPGPSVVFPVVFKKKKNAPATALFSPTSRQPGWFLLLALNPSSSVNRGSNEAN